MYTTKVKETVEEALSWLQNNYRNSTFFTERDIVWTIQTHLIVKLKNSSFKVFNDYALFREGKRRMSADIVIINKSEVEIALEFKYEPNHNRQDIDQKKMDPSVVFWKGEGSVEKDIKRIREYVINKRAKIACSIFIDEGRFFYNKYNASPLVDSKWFDWGAENPAVLISWAHQNI